MKPTSVVATSQAGTLGDTALRVRSRPCTTHGWRPISVKIQPAVLARIGSAIAHVVSRRNRRDRSSVPRQSSHIP